MIFSDELPIGIGENRYYLVESELWSEGIYFITLVADDGSLNAHNKVIKIR